MEQSGIFWIGTESDGLVKFDGSNFTTYNRFNSGLPNNKVTTITCDPDGSVWIGTEGGLANLNGSLWTIYNQDSGLPDNEVTDIVIDEQNTLWIAMDGGGLAKLDGEELTTFDLTGAGMPTSYLTSLTIDNDGNIWAGTWNSGIIKFDGTTFSSYTCLNSRLNFDYINTLYTDAYNNLWIGTSRCITLYNKDGVILSNNKSVYEAIAPLQTFPNPADDMFRVSLPKGVSLTGYEIMAVTGQIIQPYKPATQTNIPVSTLNSGVYILKLHTSSGTKAAKFVKE